MADATITISVEDAGGDDSGPNRSGAPAGNAGGASPANPGATIDDALDLWITLLKQLTNALDNAEQRGGAGSQRAAEATAPPADATAPPVPSPGAAGYSTYAEPQDTGAAPERDIFDEPVPRTDQEVRDEMDADRAAGYARAAAEAKAKAAAGASIPLPGGAGSSAAAANLPPVASVPTSRSASAGGHNASAFDRPIPVIIMGPRPLLVTMVGGSSSKAADAAKPPKPSQGDTDAESQAQAARYAQIGARAVMREGDHKYQQAGAAIGSVAGAAVGGAVGGPVGAAVGGVVGEKAGSEIGKRLDDPLFRLTDAFNRAGKVVDFTGEAFKRVAGNDAMGLFAMGVDAAAQGLEEIPIVGKAAAAGLQLVGKAFTAVKDVADAFAARGKELSGYQGNLAASAARQDVTRTLTDINEAQRLGDKYARLIDKQTEFEETLKAGLLPIKDFLLENLPKLLNWILDVLMKSLECLDKMVPGRTIMGDMLDEMRKMRAAIAAGVPAPLDNWTRIAAMGLRFPGPGGAPAGGLPGGGVLPLPLGIPAFAP